MQPALRRAALPLCSHWPCSMQHVHCHSVRAACLPACLQAALRLGGWAQLWIVSGRQRLAGWLAHVWWLAAGSRGGSPAGAAGGLQIMLLFSCAVGAKRTWAGGSEDAAEAMLLALLIPEL